MIKLLIESRYYLEQMIFKVFSGYKKKSLEDKGCYDYINEGKEYYF